MISSDLKKRLKAIEERKNVKIRPLAVLLKCRAKDLTDTEIDRLVHEVPVNQIPDDVLETVLDRELEKVNRYFGTSFKTAGDIPDEYLLRMARGELD